MDKILVKVIAPAVGESYDLFVPLDVEIGQLTAIIAKGVADLSSGKYVASGSELLSRLTPECLLNPAYTLRQYSVPDGAELMIL